MDLAATAARRLAGESRLRLAIVFGSAARGLLREDSDLDIAILPRDPSLSLADELELQSELARACGRSVDLVRLDRAQTLVQWEVARHGVVILADPPEEYPRFIARAASEYLDAAPALSEAARRYARRILER